MKTERYIYVVPNGDLPDSTNAFPDINDPNRWAAPSSVELALSEGFRFMGPPDVCCVNDKWCFWTLERQTMDIPNDT